jgi:hypothetical protein
MGNIQMKTVTKYYCEICGGSYSSKESAEECEAEGRPPTLPIGTIFNNATKDSFYYNITFSIADHVFIGHGYYPPLRVCRDTGVGDSLTEFCGSGGNISLGERDKPDINHPTFIRMVNYLKSVGIKPMIWDGKKSVPYKEK